MAELKHPIREAERYLQNARQILSEKAEKDGNYYNDSKYVKMAGNTAWNGVLVALDAAFAFPKASRRKKRFDIRDYQDAMSKKDPRMTRPLHSAYETLHLYLGYDGNPRYKIVQDGLEQAKEMISWAEKHYKPSKTA
jgi:hypothetical protein